jgi:hypothetical protein
MTATSGWGRLFVYLKKDTFLFNPVKNKFLFTMMA